MPARRQKQPNYRLRTAREQRGWSLKYVAEQVGTDSFTVDRWELGVQGTSPHFRRKLCELFGMDAFALGLAKERTEKASAVSEAPRPPIWQVPFLRNPYRVGLDQLVEELRRRLAAEQGGLSLLALSGLGGIGKTQLALEYVYRYGQDYQAVLWVHADSPEQLSTDLQQLAKPLDVAETRKPEPNPAYLVNEVKHWLREHGDWLLVLDNAEEHLKREFFSSLGNRGHILLTTRSERVADLGQHFAVEKMSREMGTLFLLQVIHGVQAPATLEAFPAGEREEALALARVLGGLPLALEQAGAYMREKGRSLADYRRAYQRYRKIFLAWRSKRQLTYTDYDESVATTWLPLFQRVRQQSRVALALLQLCAYLHPDAIPSDIILKGKHDPHSGLQRLADDALQLDDACGVLMNYALIRRNVADGMLSLHRLVQAVLKDGMSKDLQRLWAERAVRAVESAWSQAAESDAEHYLPHAYACATLIKELDMTGEEELNRIGEEAARLLDRAAHAADARGCYTKAIKLFLRAQGAFADLHGENDPYVLDLSLNVAHAHMKIGIYGMAALMYRKTYKDCAHIYGPDHPITIACLNSLALAELRQGSVVAAMMDVSDVYDLLEGASQQNAIESAKALQTAGEVQQLAGNVEQAEKCYLMALDVRQSIYGPRHPEVAQSLLILGAFYAQYDPPGPEWLEQAERRFRETLAIRQETLGEDHPQTAYCLLHLGRLSLQRGDADQAVSCCRQAVAVFQRKLGLAHYATGQGMHCLAAALSEQKLYPEAERYYLGAKEIYGRSGGPESDLYLRLLSEYAELLRATGREDEARQYVDYVENTRQRVATKGPILTWELPSLDEEEEALSSYIFALSRHNWTLPQDLL
jgi:transcriptional regulator with XRE-family HTH domain